MRFRRLPPAALTQTGTSACPHPRGVLFSAVLHQRRCEESRCTCSAADSDTPNASFLRSPDGNEPQEPLPDLNRLQTRLNMAIAAEDYRLAGRIQQEITEVMGDSAAPHASWQDLGMPDWLALRVEDLGFISPLDIQRHTAPPIVAGMDAVIRSQTGSGKTLAFLMPLLASLDYPPDVYPDDLKGPQAVIVVPHRELGVQIAMLIYRIFGGSVNSGIPGNRANMFTYTGPRGIKVRGVLDKAEVLMAKTGDYIKHVHVVVGTPDCLAEVGATMDESFCHEALEEGWLSRDYVDICSYDTGIPSSLRHRFVIIPEGMSPVSLLVKLLRADAVAQGADGPPPRVIAFTNSSEQAESLATPLRNALWEEHRIGLLLPDGEHPVLILQEFRDNKTSMLLATPSSARGLDLPAVSHVYNFGLPDDATEYLHRAGRTGRLGMDTNGLVTTIVSKDEVPKLLDMATDLKIAGTEMNLDAIRNAAASSGGIVSDSDGALEGTKKELEDLFNLY